MPVLGVPMHQTVRNIAIVENLKNKKRTIYKAGVWDIHLPALSL